MNNYLDRETIMSKTNIESQLAKILSESPSAPFLFIGSGFSRRYIDLPDWKGLLEHFSKRPFTRYLSKADNNYPKAALALAEDFHEEWWEKNEKNHEIYNSANWINKIETPLKYEVAEYLQDYSINDDVMQNPELVELMNNNVVIDGIITTNWDLLLENIFPKLKVYVGQSDILFKHPQAVGEIFKIHGCCSNFNSLILSSNDYENFNDKNPYLAAKLISIFLEKPVIFLGYSLSDDNIKNILEKIENVIDSEDKIIKLSKNMIFVSRANGSGDEVSRLEMPINDKRLTFTHIKTDDFGKIFRALQYAERKIPIDFLRIFKEQIYNIVNSKEKADLRLKHVDFDSLMEGDDIEFVAGVGVASISEFGIKGISGITAKDLIRDIVCDDLDIPSDEIIKILPKLIKGTPTYIPIRKYLNGSNLQLKNDESTVKNRLKLSTKSYIDKTTNSKKMSADLQSVSNYNDILSSASYDKNKKLDLLGVWLASNKTIENCTNIKEELKSNYDDWISTSNYSNFKRLVCIVDEIANNDLKS